MGVSRSGYYEWAIRHNSGSLGVDEDGIILRNEIQKIALEYTKYGYRRVKFELLRLGSLVNEKRVRRIMREDNLLVVRHTFRPVTTDSGHGLPIYTNLAKDPELTGLNQLWVADITYIQLREEFVFLAVIVDVFSRRCIGWNLGRRLYTSLTIGALKMALKKRRGQDLTGLIHHSD